LIEAQIRRPAFPLAFGCLLAIAAAVAIYGFGSPAWVLAPIAWFGVAIYGELAARFRHVTRQRGS